MKSVSSRRGAAVLAADIAASAITAMVLTHSHPLPAFEVTLGINALAYLVLPGPGASVPLAILRTVADLLRMAAWFLPGAAWLRGRQERRHGHLGDAEIARFWRDEARRSRP